MLLYHWADPHLDHLNHLTGQLELDLNLNFH